MKKNIITIIPFLITIGCIIAFNLIGSEVLPDGTLQEPFFLIPIAWLFLLIGIVSVVIRLSLLAVVKFKVKY